MANSCPEAAFTITSLCTSYTEIVVIVDNSTAADLNEEILCKFIDQIFQFVELFRNPLKIIAFREKGVGTSDSSIVDLKGDNNCFTYIGQCSTDLQKSSCKENLTSFLKPFILSDLETTFQEDKIRCYASYHKTAFVILTPSTSTHKSIEKLQIDYESGFYVVGMCECKENPFKAVKQFETFEQLLEQDKRYQLALTDEYCFSLEEKKGKLRCTVHTRLNADFKLTPIFNYNTNDPKLVADGIVRDGLEFKIQSYDPNEHQTVELQLYKEKKEDNLIFYDRFAKSNNKWSSTLAKDCQQSCLF